jgi:hypothetical protein
MRDCVGRNRRVAAPGLKLHARLLAPATDEPAIVHADPTALFAGAGDARWAGAGCTAAQLAHARPRGWRSIRKARTTHGRRTAETERMRAMVWVSEAKRLVGFRAVRARKTARGAAHMPPPAPPSSAAADGAVEHRDRADHLILTRITGSPSFDVLAPSGAHGIPASGAWRALRDGLARFPPARGANPRHYRSHAASTTKKTAGR